MKRTCLFLVILSATFLSATTSVSAQPEKATAAIQQLMQEEAVIGLSVAVVKNGNIIYNESFGWKNRETQTPLTNESIFRIASISKSFTATALMQLVEKGKLSLDDDVSNLVGFKVINPKYPDTKITLRHLLSHRSGINDSQGYFSLDAINPDKNPNWAKCYNDYEPGKGYQYCNLNFNMAGAILERATGERFDKHIQKKILKPMKLYGGYRIDGLDSTRFATIYEYDSAGNFKAAPAAYAPRREEIAAYVQGYSTPIFSPTGGMKISAADLARYMTMHMQQGKYKRKKIIAAKSAATMQTSLSGKEEGYGLALTKTAGLIPGKMMTGHTGSAYGLYSAMFFQPEEKFGIVVISNGCDPKYESGFNGVIRKAILALYDTLIK